jgi:peptide/nickel transport system permease protein
VSETATLNRQLAADPLTRSKPRNYYTQVLRRLRQSPSAIVGSIVITTMVVLAVFAQQISPFDPLEMRSGPPFTAPGVPHLMGTDQFGRDLFSRVLYGAQLSLRIGIISVVIGLFTGTFLGLVSGYYGGWWDRIIMRFIDAMLAFPGIMLALAIVATLGSSLTNVMIAVGVAYIPTYTRLVRSTVLANKEEIYVLAAQSVGARTPRILLRHILPNILAPIIVLSTVSIGTAIISAASLGYLGLGAQPPTPEWGLILNQGRSHMRQAWWISTFPGLMIMVTVFAINMLGDGLRDALDPRMGE